MNDRRLEGTQNGSAGTASATSFDDQVAAAAAAAGPPTRAGPGSERTYTAADVVRLRGSVQEEHTLARLGAERLWSLLHSEDYVNALGALTGNQAVQQVKAGLKAIYLSGWQVAADANLAGQTYPDQSLYPVNSVPQVVRRINNALLRADQITWAEVGRPADAPHWLAPIVADAEAGFGGVLNAFELMKSMIAAGRRRGALGGPAGLGEEVRPPGRQGADPDRPAHQDAERRAAGRRRLRRAARSWSPGPTPRPRRC